MRIRNKTQFIRREGSFADILEHDMQSQLHRLWCELRKMRGGGRYANASATPSPFPGYFPTPPTQPPPTGWCPTAVGPCASLISSPTESALRGQSRTGQYTNPGLAGLAAGASSPFVFSATLSPGASDTLVANSMWRTVQVVDLIATGLGLTSLDDVQLNLFVSGIPRGSWNGGIFSRSNANACTPACGISVCAGPLETISITATNLTALAFGPTVNLKLTTRTIYSGEPGFTCAAEGSCLPGQVQVVQQQQSECPSCGGEGGE